MPLIPLANCLVQSTSFPHAFIRVIRFICAIRDISCRSSCPCFPWQPSRSLRENALRSALRGPNSNRCQHFDFDCAAGATCYDTDIRFYDDDDHTALYPWENRLWDMGAVPLSTVLSAPSSGGSRWSYTDLIVGHTYVMETDQGYAKFYIVSLQNAE